MASCHQFRAESKKPKASSALSCLATVPPSLCIHKHVGIMQTPGFKKKAVASVQQMLWLPGLGLWVQKTFGKRRGSGVAMSQPSRRGHCATRTLLQVSPLSIKTISQSAENETVPCWELALVTSFRKNIWWTLIFSCVCVPKVKLWCPYVSQCFLSLK